MSLSNVELTRRLVGIIESECSRLGCRVVGFRLLSLRSLNEPQLSLSRTVELDLTRDRAYVNFKVSGGGLAMDIRVLFIGSVSVEYVFKASEEVEGKLRDALNQYLTQDSQRGAQ